MGVRWWISLGLAGAISACGVPTDNTASSGQTPQPAVVWSGADTPAFTGRLDAAVDRDADGFDSLADCDDSNPDVHPDAVEVPYNGIDDDCNPFSVDDDLDRDGFASADDCDDSDPQFAPGVPELCDGLDNDCDGMVDETEDVRWFRDDDGDGWGDPYRIAFGCDLHNDPGWSPLAGDCVDGDATINPSIPERCDGRDEDCDGLIDEESVDALAWFVDADGDGHGIGSPRMACTVAPGEAATSDDCDDTRADVNPSAPERCDGIDHNCDGDTQDNATDAVRYYADADGDGHGDPLLGVLACTVPLGHVALADDCDDQAADRYPGAPETCDAIDQDCDGTVDNSPVDGTTLYTDLDRDGHGAPSTATVQCLAGGQVPVGQALTPTDCDDTSAEVRPGAPERCNGIDDDCDPLTPDEANLPASWFRDADGDGYGDPFDSQPGCSAPAGYVLSNLDCDDTTASVRPAATEVCDGIDQDCDGEADEGATDQAFWFADSDGDGVGGLLRVRACEAPDGFVASSGDEACEDDATRWPGQTELCNGIDDDCDDDIDEDATADTPWYPDADGDGFGVLAPGAEPNRACLQPAAHASLAGDCDDSDDQVFPGAQETCDSIDRDCDGDPEHNAIDAVLAYVDADGDGSGNAAAPQSVCVLGAGLSLTADDCDDTRAEAFPGAAEICNGQDDNCDGSADEDANLQPTVRWNDADGDGYGDPLMAPYVGCAPPDGTVANSADCDDTNAAAFPGAVETCAPGDEDCGGDGDAGAVDALLLGVDADGDGAWSDTLTLMACHIPAGWTPRDADAPLDCQDGDAAISPFATELCAPGDENCNGLEGDDDPGVTDRAAWFADSDGDGFGGDTLVVDGCAPPATGMWTAANEDCDDADAAIFPGASEWCDTVDHNCDGDVYANARDGGWLPLDADGDGFAGEQDAWLCPAQATQAGDCDDTRPATYPGATETCDGIDNDCNGWVDGSGPGEAPVCSDCATVQDDVAAWLVCATPQTYDTRAAGCPMGWTLGSLGQTDAAAVLVAAAAHLGPYSVWVNADIVGPGTGLWQDGTALETNDMLWSLEPAPGETGALVWQQPDGARLGLPGDTYGVICQAPRGELWFQDADGDGFGDASVTWTGVPEAGLWAPRAGDCNDLDPNQHPNNDEVCDGSDNDCDGQTDEDAIDNQVWFVDADGDGYGGDTFLQSCGGYGLVELSGDCDDEDVNVHPGLVEWCDGLDNNCDGLVDNGADEAGGAFLRFVDADNDGWAADDAPTFLVCPSEPGFTDLTGDCDDTDSALSPGAAEFCDGLDQDCDGIPNLGACGLCQAVPLQGRVLYACPASERPTQPGSALPTPESHCGDMGMLPVWASDVPPGLTVSDLDFDGESDGIWLHEPGCDVGADCPQLGKHGVERVTTLDDLGGVLCEVPSAADVLYEDGDGDGFGQGLWFLRSDLPPGSEGNGWSTTPFDCDDSTADIHPAAPEICNDQDDNCDLTVDEDAIDQQALFSDLDGDGWGTGAPTFACPALGTTTSQGDCDDFDSAVHPGAIEMTCDGTDHNCDGSEDDALLAPRWYLDMDGDGFGDAAQSLTSCEAPAGYTALFEDCDDDPAVRPGQTEACNGLDDDCDGEADEAGACPCPSTTGSNGNLYLFCDMNGSHSDARTVCQNAGFTMSTVANAAELAELTNELTQSPAAVGLSQIGATPTWHDGADVVATDLYWIDLRGAGPDPIDTGSLPIVDSVPVLGPSDAQWPTGRFCGQINLLGAPEITDCTDTVQVAICELGTPAAWSRDEDGDGFGDPNTTVWLTDTPTGAWVQDQTDCNDFDALLNPSLGCATYLDCAARQAAGFTSGMQIITPPDGPSRVVECDMSETPAWTRVVALSGADFAATPVAYDTCGTLGGLWGNVGVSSDGLRFEIDAGGLFIEDLRYSVVTVQGDGVSAGIGVDVHHRGGAGISGNGYTVQGDGLVGDQCGGPAEEATRPINVPLLPGINAGAIDLVIAQTDTTAGTWVGVTDLEVWVR